MYLCVWTYAYIYIYAHMYINIYRYLVGCIEEGPNLGLLGWIEAHLQASTQTPASKLPSSFTGLGFRVSFLFLVGSPFVDLAAQMQQPQSPRLTSPKSQTQ